MKKIIHVVLLILLGNIDCAFRESGSDTTFSILIFKLSLKYGLKDHLGLKNNICNIGRDLILIC